MGVIKFIVSPSVVVLNCSETEKQLLPMVMLSSSGQYT